MVNSYVINDCTVIVFHDGKKIVVSEDTIFIIDKSILKILFSEEHELLGDAEYLFSYLDYLDSEKENRNAIVLDTLYEQVKTSLQDKQESYRYFQGHCQSSKKFIGKQTPDDKAELLALVNHLIKTYPSVFLVSEEYYLDEKFIHQMPVRSTIVSLTELKEILSSIPNFYKFISSLFESSA